MARTHRRFYRWHIWLGWLVGVPLILWTTSGLFMVSRPIEEVRGTHLRTEITPAPLVLEKLAMFPDKDKAISEASLTAIAGEWAWVVSYDDGSIARFDPATGDAMPAIDRAAAERLAKAAYEPEEAVQSVRLFSQGDDMPMDYRRDRAAWQVHFADQTNIYIARDTGETLAVRTQFWRVFDFMWGLHIMDLQTREDTSHPILIIFAALALFGSILGFVMLFTRRRRMQHGK